MRHAETVTFGGSALDRAAHLRADADARAADPAARAIVLWQGKVMLDHEDGGLSRVPLDHPVMDDAGPLRVFLGLEDGAPVFAVPLTGWVPDLAEDDTLGAFHDPSLQRHPAMKSDAGGRACFAELRSVMIQLTPRDAELAAAARSVISWHESHKFCSACGHHSDIADAGWRRCCPDCGVSHFPRTDPVVIMLVVSGDSVLVGRSPGWPDGMYSLLAGFIEPGETVEAAVRREVFEEAGVRIGPVSYLASQPWAFPSSLMIGCLGLATTTDITVDPVELEDARWMTRSEMAQAARGDHPEVKPARAGAIAHFLLENWLADTLD